MNARESFLARVSGALGRDAPPPSPAAAAPVWLGAPDAAPERAAAVREMFARDADNLFDMLARTAAAAGWHVHHAADAEDAGRYALAVAKDLEARSGVYSPSRATLAANLGAPFAEAGIELASIYIEANDDAPEESRARLRRVMERADFGITGVDYAIAETGSVVVIPGAGVSRLSSLLPPVHIAFVERGQALPSLDELFTLRRDDFASGRLGSYMNLITGPSRTADIEYKIVTGVHGPGEVHMALIG